MLASLFAFSLFFCHFGLADIFFCEANNRKMPSETRFSGYPAFPSDAPGVKLPRVSLSKLADGDRTESDVLFQACRQHGFFLLKLTSSSEGQQLLKDAESMFDVSLATLSLDRATPLHTIRRKICWGMSFPPVSRSPPSRNEQHSCSGIFF